MFFTTMAISTV